MHTRLHKLGVWLAIATALACSAGASALARARASAASTYQNVQVSHDSGANAEPSLAVDPRHPSNMLAVSMVINHHHVTVASSRSSDGGLSWAAGGRLETVRAATWTGDVTAAFDDTGHGYVTAAYQTAARGDGILLWRTNDSGLRFSGPLTVARVPFADRPSLAISPAQPGRPQTLYIEWRDRHGLIFTRSTDAGHSFSPARTIVTDNGVYIPAIASGGNGLVTIAFESIAEPGRVRRRLF